MALHGTVYLLLQKVLQEQSQMQFIPLHTHVLNVKHTVKILNGKRIGYNAYLICNTDVVVEIFGILKLFGITNQITIVIFFRVLCVYGDGY